MNRNLLKCVCCGYTIPQQFVVLASLCLTVVVMFGTRTCLLYTIDKIVVDTTDPAKESQVCKESSSESVTEVGKFSWSFANQKSIFFAFLPGYAITNVPGGLLADNYGGKYALFIGILLSGVLSIAVPLTCSDNDYFIFVVLRFLMGLAQGPGYPCVFAILSNWTQSTRRGLFGSFVFASGSFGAALSDAISIVLLKHCSWKSLYYLWGIVAIIWSIFFALYCFTDPFTDSRVTEEELTILSKELGRKQVVPVPWRAFFKTSSTWGYLCGYAALEILYALYVFLMPEYFYNIIKYDRNFHVRLVPTLLYAISSVAFGVIFDKLFVVNKFSLVKLHRMMTIIGTIIPSIFVTGIPLVKCNQTSSYYLYLFGMIFLGSGDAGIKINVLDISRNLPGFTLGIAGCIGQLIHIFLPKLIHASQEENIFDKWESCIIFAFFSVIILSAFYCFSIKTEPQAWDKPQNI